MIRRIQVQASSNSTKTKTRVSDGLYRQLQPSLQIKPTIISFSGQSKTSNLNSALRRYQNPNQPLVVSGRVNTHNSKTLFGNEKAPFSISNNSNCVPVSSASRFSENTYKPLITGQVSHDLNQRLAKLKKAKKILPVRTSRSTDNQNHSNLTTNSRWLTPKNSKTSMNLSELNAQIYTRDYQNEIKRRQTTQTQNVDRIKSSSLQFFPVETDKKNSFKKKKPKFRLLPLMGLSFLTTSVLVVILLFSGVFGNLNFDQFREKTAVAGVNENITPEWYEDYSLWSQEVSGQFLEPESDEDQDDLSNFEEFLIGSNPLEKFTCDPTVSDSQNLFNLINPKTCEAIDLSNTEELELFSQVINLEKVNQGFMENLLNSKSETSQEPTESATSSNPGATGLMGLFGITSYGQLNQITPESLEAEMNLKKQKQDYLKLISKIDKYIQKHRSYEVYDRNYAAPVHPATYLDVAIRYNVPLKYVLALARNESRFGTDRYTQNGNLTRPGQYQNIYSIGLTDGGSNLGFATWEEGVEAFGKWYTRFHQRGVSDCAKWRIYNPNGDYCQKVERLAAEIDIYLRS